MAKVVFYIILSALALASGSVFYKIGGKRRTCEKSSPALLCFLYFIFACIGFSVIALIQKASFIPTLPTLITGIIAGMSFSAAAYLYIISLASGPFTISAVILNFSNFAPILYCMIFPKEHVSLIKWCGIVIMIFSVYVLTSRNKTANEKNVSAKWILYISLTFIFNSLISYMIRIQNYYSNINGKNETFLFYIILFLSAALISFIIFVFAKGFKTKQNAHRLVYPALGLAVTISANTLTQSLLYNLNVPVSIQSPIINGLSILSTALFGRIFFRDKLSVKAKAGVVLGVVAIVILSI